MTWTFHAACLPQVTLNPHPYWIQTTCYSLSNAILVAKKLVWDAGQISPQSWYHFWHQKLGERRKYHLHLQRGWDQFDWDMNIHIFLYHESFARMLKGNQSNLSIMNPWKTEMNIDRRKCISDRMRSTSCKMKWIQDRVHNAHILFLSHVICNLIGHIM